MILPSRSQLIRDSSLTKTDLLEIAKHRGDPHRLGFVYQLGFVRAPDFLLPGQEKPSAVGKMSELGGPCDRTAPRVRGAVIAFPGCTALMTLSGVSVNGKRPACLWV